MTLQAQPAMEKASDLNSWTAHRHSEEGEGEALEAIKSIVVDTVVDVGALIDAVLCRCGDWVNWQRYRPLPGTRTENRGAPDLIIRLALAEDIFGLRSGGYIEMHVAREKRVIEVHGGYYDSYDQPEAVIDGSLRWNEVNHRDVGQMLLAVHERILRAHLAREASDQRPVRRSALWAAPASQLCGDSNSAACCKAIGVE